MGSSMAYGEYALQAWPWPSKASRQRIMVEGAQPILLVGNTNDPATPFCDGSVGSSTVGWVASGEMEVLFSHCLWDGF